MKKLDTSQKIVLISGIIGSVIGIYGKFAGWEYDDYFIFFYTGVSLTWVAFLKTDRRCLKIFKKQSQA
ncbi:hypothetical protein DKG77_06745 [Flagellimonas aquimarina]|uniref:Uncharacterized protein n=1 Tax=Flagellimonas aquimarina TaxID=2201895 RepID=A0A316KW25_9FLAO|nr:hypothetical protein [Allomuricauda koreensis]PWL37984.1 hypothetical protein DKG77_06745 [Allomuricauda koreensis]